MILSAFCFCVVSFSTTLAVPIATNDLHILREGYMQWGDMIVPENLLSTDKEKNAIATDAQLWSGGVVNFIIDPSLSHLRSVIQEAMSDIESNTCVRFHELTFPLGNYVHFFQGEGCYSYVGMAGGRQPISLGNGCWYTGTTVHEISHALGFYHEQSRSDRDENIVIHWENIMDGYAEQFQILGADQNRLLTPYNTQGIMTYGEYAFSKEPGVLKTMEALNGDTLTEPYSKPGLSADDARRINLLYRCGEDREEIQGAQPVGDEENEEYNGDEDNGDEDDNGNERDEGDNGDGEDEDGNGDEGDDGDEGDESDNGDQGNNGDESDDEGDNTEKKKETQKTIE